MASRVSSGVALGVTRDLHAFVGGVADQLEDVLALQRVAAGEDEDGHAHVGDLVDQRLAFGVGQFVGMGDGLGGGAAVLAGQVAGLRDLPDGQEGRFRRSSNPPRAGMLCIGCMRPPSNRGRPAAIGTERLSRNGQDCQRPGGSERHDSASRRAVLDAGAAVIGITLCALELALDARFRALDKYREMGAQFCQLHETISRDASRYSWLWRRPIASERRLDAMFARSAE